MTIDQQLIRSSICNGARYCPSTELEVAKEGRQYTAEQIEALHRFLGDEGFHEFFDGEQQGDEEK